MALPNLPVPPFPNVPQAPGVPPVARDTSAVLTPTPTPLKADDSSVSQGQSGPRWGVYTADGALALDPDSIVSVGYSKDWRVADYPMEKGAFQSYNKVTRPYENRVSMTKAGDVTARANFITTLDALAESLDLSNIVTPEKTYLNANITRVAYDRAKDSGSNMIIAEISFIEIRNTVTTTFSNTKTASGASQVNDGVVQTRDLSTDEQATLDQHTLESEGVP